MTITIKGLEDLKINLAKVNVVVTGPGLLKALSAAGLVGETRAKMIARDKKILDTGHLIVSIQAKKPVLTFNGGEVEIGVGADYAIYQEFGTSKMAARPFLRPAILEGRAPIQSAFSNVLKSEINNAIR